MHSTSADVPYHEQNLWMIDERLTYHSFIASDKQLRTLDMLRSKSALRGDIVIFDEKILFADTNPEIHRSTQSRSSSSSGRGAMTTPRATTRSLSRSS